MNLDGVIITINDMREVHCARGIRKWFTDNNLDMKDFIAHGIAAQTLYDTGDRLAQAIVERKVNGK